MNEKLSLPKEVCGIIETLEAKGYEAYAVGGAVRDLLLGVAPGDFDVTTSALPEEVKAVFPRTIDTGIAHGTVTVMKHGVGYEVTTYRIDGKYSDGRHPEAVEFTRSLREDLRRRDFTVNAMAYNERTGLVDLFGGREDLERGVIRAVGNPEERFQEDALRIMRCVRFAAQLNFEIEEKTLAAAAALSGNLQMISRERIREEFLKILLSGHPEELMTLYRIGGFRGWYEGDSLGNVAAFSREEAGNETQMTAGARRSDTGIAVSKEQSDTGVAFRKEQPDTAVAVGNKQEDFSASLERTIRVIRQLPKDRILRLSGFLADAISDPEDSAWRVLTELKFDNETRDAVTELVSYRDLPAGLSKTEVRKLIAEIGYTQFDRLMCLLEAEYLADKSESKLLDSLDTIREYRREIELAGDCVSMREMKLTGKDLIRMGVAPGKAMGDLLKQLFTEVLECPELNTEEALQARAQELLRK